MSVNSMLVSDCNPKSETRNPKLRPGFTLVELLVAIGIIMVLAALALAFLPKREVRLAIQGADQLQTYIASAKSRALRDKAPRGIRLIQSPQGGFREFQYIEVPEPYAPNAFVTVPPGSNVANVRWDLSGGSVQYGDMLEFTTGQASIHRVTAVGGYNPANGITQVTLASVPPNAATSFFVTTSYRFVRQPRPLLGETALQLPTTVFVSPDSTMGGQSLNIPQAYDFPVSGNWDIIFSSSGEVINAIGGRIVLWVQDDNNVSQPTLLTIYTYTGGCASHPPGPPGQPYLYTQDGRSSGQ
jgi:prepilin-type N-terminal cleavage/methylation domain-containing protein